MPGTIRLDKFLADMGKGTRSQIRDAIKGGRVRVNGAVCLKADCKISASGDAVFLDGAQVSYVFMEYYMLNKPAGVLSATGDRTRRTVLDLIGERARRDLFPVGRLDADTEGLLLITNDGELAHRLLSPKNHVDKVYAARCSGKPQEGAARLFEEGLVLPDGLRCLPARLEVLKIGDSSALTEARITVHEGKFHQVKRMMEAVGCPVVELKRLSMGPLLLDWTLRPGEYRKLTDKELESLKRV